jgi:hypothetical protein
MPIKYPVAHNQPAVKDLIAPFRWHLFLHRRTHTYYGFDLAA